MVNFVKTRLGRDVSRTVSINYLTMTASKEVCIMVVNEATSAVQMFVNTDKASNTNYSHLMITFTSSEATKFSQSIMSTTNMARRLSSYCITVQCSYTYMVLVTARWRSKCMSLPITLVQLS